MFEVLVESGARGRAAVGPRVTSVVVHGGLIVLAAAGVNRSVAAPLGKPIPVLMDVYVPPVRTPVDASGGGPALPGTVLGPPPTVPIDAPTALPPVGMPVVSPVTGPTPQEIVGRELLGDGSGAAHSNPGPVLLAGEGDEPVTVLVPARLVYPARLAAAGIAGDVRLEFVVDTAGKCEPMTVRVLASTHQGFEASARDAVCDATYRPGRVRGQAVRQLVQQKVTFRQR